MVKMYSLNKLFELKFSGKTSEEKKVCSKSWHLDKTDFF